MVLTIASLDSAGKVDNWILGRADLRLRFSCGISCLLPADFGRMCAFGPGLLVMMAMVMMDVVMMTMVMVLVMVIIVPEALGQVGWLRQRQHRSFHRLRAFY